MPSWNDALGRSWSMLIDVNALRRVRARTGKKLGDLDGGELQADPVLLADVLFAIVEPDADKRNIDVDAFAAGLVGDALEAAADAFGEALADFFPSRRRDLFRHAMAEGKKQALAQIEAAEAELAKLEIAPQPAEATTDSQNP